MNTKLVYLEDAYLNVLESRIVNSEGNTLVLDQTIFYPEGGGQPCDQGTIKTETGEIRVDKVSMSGDVVVHEGKIRGTIKANQSATCAIDWKRRLHNMQVHSAGHVVHEAVKILLQDAVPVDGQHGKNAHIQYQGSIEKILERRIMDRANHLIEQNLTINTEFVTLDELQKRAAWLPSKLPTNKPLRIMWIGDFSPIPDGGTQVSKTGEIPKLASVRIEQNGETSKVFYELESDHVTEDEDRQRSTSPTSMDNNKLLNIKNEALAQIIGVSDVEELERLRAHYLGKNGVLNQIAKDLPQLDKQERMEMGQVFNDVKKAISESLASKSDLKASVQFDSTMPGIKLPEGHLHPVTHAIEEISDVFEKIGFVRVRYPEADWDWYAFESLNMPKGHPARDDWETFFVDLPEDAKMGRVVLTPHTSNGQVREMERLGKPPIRMINIAKCYRRQSDVSHTAMFHQFEGLVVDRHISIAHLKGTIDHFVKQFFGPNRKSRLRPYHFQFTEPSFEVDVTCDICLGKGCRLCKEGWLELGGAGMVHPNVLKAGKIDPKEFSGFAFGWGVERTYMMKSGVKIDDLRLLYGNDIRFLQQF